MIKVEIDPNAGFCAGVIRAIGNAESFLRANQGKPLYSLGEIVHNEYEIKRLSNLGLVALDFEDIYEIGSAHGESILIRAHGQPPSTYDTLKKLGFNIIDCTCGVVLGIQKAIREAGGEIIIYGKRGHPEVLGLVGQVEGRRVRVIENMADALSLLEDDCPEGHCEIFSQTTMSPVEYERICTMLSAKLPQLVVHNTICRQVAGRYRQLEEFARSHDAIVFVSGKSSSNGKVLSSLCKSCNIRSYQVGGIGEIQPSWFRAEDCVGISGATSTPRWLLEQVAGYIANLQ
ncbi:MAG: 4-hydroxy-3-methylbut-2-enyl diphosphate reductase [Candidatus Cryptobacteroides sp.]